MQPKSRLGNLLLPLLLGVRVCVCNRRLAIKRQKSVIPQSHFANSMHTFYWAHTNYVCEMLTIAIRNVAVQFKVMAEQGKSYLS